MAAAETARDWEACRFARGDAALHREIFEDRITIEGGQNFTTKNFQEVSVFTLVVTGGRTSVVLNAVNTTQPAKRCKIRHF